ncbi:hypothetical protein D3C80_1450420 [compost metagenome]
MQALQKLRRNIRGINIFTADFQRLVGNNVGDVKLVFITFRSVGSIDIVDQTFVQRPGIDLAFPFINDRVAKTIDFRLLVRNACLDPSGAGGFQRVVARCSDQCVNSLFQFFRCVQRVFVLGVSQFRIVLEHSRRIGCCTSWNGGKCGRGGQKRQRGAENGFADHGPSFCDTKYPVSRAAEFWTNHKPVSNNLV